MDWRDQGALLSVRRHGESAAIIDVFTEHHGRHAGVVRGGASRKLAPILQPGAQLDVEWRARLDEHLGTFRVEPLISRAAVMMDDRAALAGLNAVCGLLKFALPEREAHPRMYKATQDLLAGLMAGGAWQRDYLFWELLLLEDTGFGLDLTQCAVTGATEGLLYVSPKTGRSVSQAGAGDWAERLLPYPAPEIGITKALATTGYFLQHWLATALGGRDLPEVRGRLVEILERQERKAT
ncbi:MAG: DNA repair protein RecO [Rhodobacterales bacterium]|jgi:DNA repair protein RecO (recombination protein O)|nr:DNA repair protein RecO [Pseudomonadota bacterium]MDA1286308.1 DNA repair protein RecO [Pseudomonadota bacterium]NQW15561.1 DNA repair protein RecO [Rhodobacter sp.]